MKRPEPNDWTSIRGRTRINDSETSISINRLGASKNVVINDLNVSNIQAHKWLIRYNNTSMPIGNRIETIASYDSSRGLTIGDL